MAIGLATAHGLVQEGIASIPAEQVEEICRLVLDQCDQLMQRLMPRLDEGPPTPELIDNILKVQARVPRLHGLGGRGGDVNMGIAGGDGDRDEVRIASIRANAPVLRPDGPIPANPIP